mmetsp:Transcript_19131/g.27659  ORF Transcript_19131/g.27659 Transcript_19131/m.27659 type:complete len:451 (-) Transcript_19131:258-1610(-)
MKFVSSILVTLALTSLNRVESFSVSRTLQSPQTDLHTKNYLSSRVLSSTARLSTATEDETTLAKATATPSSSLESTAVAEVVEEQEGISDYAKGFLIIGFITFLNASSNPMWHAATAGGGPPPLLLNAAVSSVAFLGLLAGGSLLDSNVGTMSNLAENDDKDDGFQNWYGGMELGFWKFLGTTCHIYGLSLTTANHGAFLIQLTTLIVPVIQGLQGERISRQMQAAVGLALLGVFAFTQDPSSAAEGADAIATQTIGDALCVACALFYSFYDIQTFKWGKLIPRTQLVTTKIGTQALLSMSLCGALAWDESAEFFANNPDLLAGGSLLVPVVLWTGLIVNALATFLQVGGMQAIGPTRAQTIFASQPLMSAILSFIFLGETIGIQGAAGGSAFLFALYLAITSPKDEEATVIDGEVCIAVDTPLGVACEITEPEMALPGSGKSSPSKPPL